MDHKVDILMGHKVKIDKPKSMIRWTKKLDRRIDKYYIIIIHKNKILF